VRQVGYLQRIYCQLLNNTSTEHWWDDTDTAKPKYLDKTMSYCHFSHHRSNMTGLKWNSVLRAGRSATNSLSHATTRLSRIQKLQAF